MIQFVAQRRFDLDEQVASYCDEVVVYEDLVAEGKLTELPAWFCRIFSELTDRAFEMLPVATEPNVKRRPRNADEIIAELSGWTPK